ncbi:RDD family protein [Novipirellula caenicola]|uniref:RDD domain-containing protein n=1 Tax=Novipirellula caenicola TaxID=1536901 RepID=A0ABP9VN89_9BACT
MKIKCPACSAVLNIPESAAGKVVKCPCGKQLRAPGGAAKPAATAAAAANPNRAPAAQRPTAPRPAPQPAGPSAGDFDPAMFDDLTDDDLKQPVLPVQRPGFGGGAPAATNPYAVGAAGAMPSPSSGNIAGIGKRIGGALLDGLFYMAGYIVVAVMMGLLMPAAEAGDNPAATGIGLVILLVALCIMLVPFIINMVLISMSGQSLGKKIVKTRIVDRHTGIPVGFLHGVLIRNLAFGAITGIPIIGGVIALVDIGFLFSENHETLHDKLAQTLVVEA